MEVLLHPVQPALGQFWAYAGSIDPEPAQCWHVTTCLQRVSPSLNMLTLPNSSHPAILSSLVLTSSTHQHAHIPTHAIKPHGAMMDPYPADCIRGYPSWPACMGSLCYNLIMSSILWLCSPSSSQHYDFSMEHASFLCVRSLCYTCRCLAI